MSKHVLEISGIRKNFREKSILSDVFLRCCTSDVIGILGRNGSGKSTLFKIITGLVAAQDKCICIDSVSMNNQKNLLSEIAYLSQEHFIPNHLSVKRAIFLSVDKQKQPFFCDDNFIDSILAKRINNLSTGELRYLEIKIVLFNAVKFVLLDEPFKGLSPVLIDVISEMIRVHSDKKGIMITDHNYDQVIKITTQLFLIRDGRLIKVNKTKDLDDNGYFS